MAQLRDDLVAILVSANAPQVLNDILVKNNLLEVDQLALMATDENRLEDKVFPVFKAAGVPTDTLPDQIAIKKAWHLARKSLTDSKKVHTGTAQEDDVTKIHKLASDISDSAGSITK